MSPTAALDRPVWAALTGPQATLAIRHGQAVRFPADMSPFVDLAVGVDGHPDPAAWQDLHTLLGASGRGVLAAPVVDLPGGWTELDRDVSLQLTAAPDSGAGAGGARVEEAAAAGDCEVEVLGPADVPEMLALVARARPGPFLRRTAELGTYQGIRCDGRLVAMAGERVHPPGWVEISAVCTDPAYRGRGLAARVVSAAVRGIHRRSHQAFLHTATSNAPAIRLYESLGFTRRTRLAVVVFRTPDPG